MRNYCRLTTFTYSVGHFLEISAKGRHKPFTYLFTATVEKKSFKPPVWDKLDHDKKHWQNR